MRNCLLIYAHKCALYFLQGVKDAVAAADIFSHRQMTPIPMFSNFLWLDAHVRSDALKCNIHIKRLLHYTPCDDVATVLMDNIASNSCCLRISAFHPQIKKCTMKRMARQYLLSEGLCYLKKVFGCAAAKGL